MVHVLNNVQNGLCPEDCGYCSQSRDSKAAIRKYPMKSDEEILAEAERAARAGASRYCMVLSGRGPTLERTRKLAELIREVKQRYPIEVCLSVGLLDEEHARILAEAGLDRLNHNLNTSESHYGEICSTHTYADRVATLAAAKQHGIEPCSGLIMGMGETQRATWWRSAFTLRELEVPSIPVNFLIPIEGNPVVSDGSLTPERCLRALALMRLVNPRAEIRVAGGREGHLRALGALALWPANSLFVEGYLTTRGDAVNDTYRMIRDAGFEIEGNPLSRARRGESARRRRPAAASASPAATADPQARDGARAREAPVGVDAIADEVLEAIRARGTYRRMRVLDGAQAPRMRVDGREVLLFAGSNYLDLAHHPEVRRRPRARPASYGCAAGGSRLISGNLAMHEALEAAARQVPRHRSGARLQHRLHGERRRDPGARRAAATWWSPTRSRHASIIDGCRLSRAEMRVFPHGDLDALEETLREVASPRRRRAARRRRRLQHGRRRGAARRDDAARPALGRAGAARRRARHRHARARGPRQRGAARRGRACRHLDGHARQGARLLRRLRRGQLQAARSAGERGAQLHLQLRARRRRRSRPPARRCAWCAREPWRREQLQANAARLRERLARHGISTAPSTTHIVPVVIGDNARTMAVCERCSSAASTPRESATRRCREGTARLRVTPMATHRGEEIDALADAIAEEAARAS